MKKYSFIVLFFVLVFFGCEKINQENKINEDIKKDNKEDEKNDKENKVFWISTPQGDYVEDTRNPNEVCLNLQKSKGFENCELIEVKESRNNKEECINGESPMGCFACKISCLISD